MVMQKKQLLIYTFTLGKGEMLVVEDVYEFV